MASIRSRTTGTGETTYSVLYREGGKQRSDTFHDQGRAEKFRQLVELLGPAKARAEMFGQDNSGLTVDELAEAFFAAKASDITPRTLADYRRDYTNWIQPFLGHRQADSVDELDVQRLVDHMKTRLDPKSVRDRHMVLGSMFRWGSAKTRRLVTHNPCLETELPKKTTKAAKGMTIPEWHQFYEIGCKDLPDVGDLAAFLVGTGWRFSEATALMVRNVHDWGDDEIFVDMAQVLRREPGKVGVVTEGGKSEDSLRRTRLGRQTAAIVRRRIIGKGPDELVFTNPSGRKWHQSNFLERHWAKAVEASKLERKPTPHWLRHTHGLLLDRAGASLAQMQKRLGHADIQTTINVYGRMIGDVTPDVLERVDAMIHDPEQVVTGEMVRELDRS